MSIQTYKPRPLTLRAVQVDGSEASVIAVMGLIGSTQGVKRVDGGLRVDRPENSVIVPNGAFLIRFSNGDLHTFPADLFESLFAKHQSKRAKYTGAVWRPEGYKKYISRIMINRVVYEKVFTENHDESVALRKVWAKKLKQKDRHGNASKTWDDFKKAWLEHLNMDEKLNPQTIRHHTLSVEKLERILKPQLLVDVTLDGVDVLKKELIKEAQTQGHGVDGVNRTLIHVKMALLWARKKGWHPNIMPEDIEKIKDKHKPKVEIFSEEELRLMLKYSSPKWRTVILFGVRSSHRATEIINQLKRNLYPDIGAGLITDNDADPARGIEEFRTKKGRSRYFLLYEDQLQAMSQVGDNRSEYVITDDDGHKYTLGKFSSDFKANLVHVNKQIKAHEPAGNRRVIKGSVKLLRKSCSSLLQANGATEDMATMALGHASKKMTQEHYTKQTLPQIVQQRIARLNVLRQYQPNLSYDKTEEQPP